MHKLQNFCTKQRGNNMKVKHDKNGTLQNKEASR